jgi:hypothetical protein
MEEYSLVVLLGKDAEDPFRLKLTLSENRAGVFSVRRTSEKLSMRWREFVPVHEPKLTAQFQHFEQLWRESGEDLAVHSEGQRAEFPLAAGCFDLAVVSYRAGGNLIRVRRAAEQRSFDIAGPLIISPFSSSHQMFSAWGLSAVAVEASRAGVRWYEPTLSPDALGLTRDTPTPDEVLRTESEGTSKATLVLPPGLYKIRVNRHVDEPTYINAQRVASAPGQLPDAAN